MSVEIREVTDHVGVADFLSLPARLYGPREPSPDTTGEPALLAGRHPLSGYFRVRPYLAYRDGRPAGRLLLTRYPDDTTVYLGCFECVEDDAVAAALLARAEDVAAEGGFERILGPVDASFWLRYRLKVSGFDQPPFFSEPVNKPYYLRLFESAGYRVCERYTSNRYPRAPVGHDFGRFDDRLRAFTRRGFDIRPPRRREWDRVMREIHGLLHELYHDFPVFKAVRFEDFAAVFGDLRRIVDLSMVTMAYHRGEAVGFLVAVPDYGPGLTSGPVAGRLLTLLRHRYRSPRYVLLYLGAQARYPGLGAAMTAAFVGRVVRRGAAAVGALIHQGTITERYAAELVTARSEYVLLRRDLDPRATGEPG